MARSSNLSRGTLAAALLIPALFGAAAVAAAHDPEACQASGSKEACLPASALGTEQDAGLAMLQQNARSGGDAGKAGLVAAAGRKGKFPDPSSVWHQLTGAVELDDVKEKIFSTTDSSMLEKLTKKMNMLTQEFPGADTIKAEFSDQWDQIKDAVNLQKLGDMVGKARVDGLPDLGDLQDKYNALKDKLPNFNLDEVQGKAADMWDKLESKNLVPSLDDLEDKAKGFFNKAKGKAKDFAKDKLDDMKDKLKDKLSGFFR